MSGVKVWWAGVVALVLVSGALPAQPLVEQVGADTGVVAIVDCPEGGAAAVCELTRGNDLLVYFQSTDEAFVAAVRREAGAGGLLGKRLFAAVAAPGEIHLADNVADHVQIHGAAIGAIPDAEALRVLRPGAAALVGSRAFTKPIPAGIDDWSHPYHGPDNNPQSRDQLARGVFRTQFIAAPVFSPMPEQTVAAGGRLFKAMGHIAHKANQNAYLNTLLCINAYNGCILWRRPLPEGFMIHRNTMVATRDALYLADHESCKTIDAATGETRGEITVPPDLTDGSVWKWMAIRNGILYALVGGPETHIDTQHSDRAGLGHWPWGMWQGHDYKNPKTAFGYGRTLLAMDLDTKELRWHRRTEEYLDGRALCMNAQHIFAFAPGHVLLAVDAATGQVAWERRDREVLDAIGPNERAQHYVTGYATTCYAKCTDQQLFFAGPQRKQMVVLSARDGGISWVHPDGNLQLVLRDDAVYAAGPRTSGVRLDYRTGKALSSLPTRRACTRATGTEDSIFYRTRGGTVRVLTDPPGAHHIAPMRPPCQDGVIVANGHLYWGPWMCGCQLSLYGNIGLGPVRQTPDPRESPAGPLVSATGTGTAVAPLNLHADDWPTYRGSNDRSDSARGNLPPVFAPAWTQRICSGVLPTAPVLGGGLLFVADRGGTVRALSLDDGAPAWTFTTSGPIYYPPVLADGRAFVGSADGWVYALEARTGRQLWRRRVGPADHRIPVYGSLVSRWPVAGGVVVQSGRVYAAAGIAHYDGTHVVALDAATGRLLAENRTSGMLAPDVGGGISLQGNVYIDKRELRFAGGGVYEIARYDLDALACLNPPQPRLTSSFQTAFYAYYPNYGRFVSLHRVTPHGTLNHAASYEGNAFGSLVLRPQPAGEPAALTAEEARTRLRRRGQLLGKDMLWQEGRNCRFTAFIAGDEILLAAGHRAADPDAPFLMTRRVRDGVGIWTQPLPADAVRGGLGIDHTGRLVVVLDNGTALCFRPDRGVEPPPERTVPPFADRTAIAFRAAGSMKPYASGTRQGQFPVQQTDDALGPFSGQGVYFQQREGQDTEVIYHIMAGEPIREIRFRGAASFGLCLNICDADNEVVLAGKGPFRKGNTYSEHTVRVPNTAGGNFILRLHNEASTWLYVERLTLVGENGPIPLNGDGER